MNGPCQSVHVFIDDTLLMCSAESQFRWQLATSTAARSATNLLAPETASGNLLRERAEKVSEDKLSASTAWVRSKFAWLR